MRSLRRPNPSTGTVLRTREFGLGLQTDLKPGNYGALARVAEEAGFDVVTAFHDLGFLPSLPALLEIASVTTRVRLGASCLNPYTLHPIEIAQQVAALDLVSGGRAFLGLAAGAWLDRIGIVQDRPFTHVTEAWALVERVLAGDERGFDGEVFSLVPGKRLGGPIERAAVPLLIGTWSPRLTRFAAAEADELKVGGSANPAMLALALERLRAGEQAVGRVPGSVGLVVGAVTVVDEDGARARNAARHRVVNYFTVVADLDPTLELDPELVRRIRSLVADGSTDEAAALLPDALLDIFAIAGTPKRVADKAEEIYACGVQRIDFGPPHGVDQRRGVALLADQVVPALRAR